MFNFCPSCASAKIVFTGGKVFRCPDCRFVYYHNIAAATGCVVSVPDADGGNTERILFLVRGKEPGLGGLDLPGGFVDVGEGVLEGLHRELGEETGWTPAVPPGASLAGVYTLFASFPNVYPYRGIPYNTCDLYFYCRAPGLAVSDIAPERSEVSGVRLLKPADIDLGEIAFDSTRRAVKAYLEMTGLRLGS